MWFPDLKADRLANELPTVDNQPSYFPEITTAPITGQASTMFSGVGVVDQHIKEIFPDFRNGGRQCQRCNHTARPSPDAQSLGTDVIERWFPTQKKKDANCEQRAREVLEEQKKSCEERDGEFYGGFDDCSCLYVGYLNTTVITCATRCEADDSVGAGWDSIPEVVM